MEEISISRRKYDIVLKYFRNCLENYTFSENKSAHNISSNWIIGCYFWRNFQTSHDLHAEITDGKQWVKI